MAAKYWIKLYLEILHDPKMGRLPDNLWRRCVELFLLAGELGAEMEDDDKGHLPCTEEIAWHLRQPESVLEIELSRLNEAEILTKTENGWIVTNFAKRQKYVDTVERMKQYRERKRQKGLKSSDGSDKKTVTSDVTKRNIESDKESDKESEEELTPGLLCQSLLDICLLKWSFVENNKPMRKTMTDTLRFLKGEGAQPGDVSDFATWRKAHHWTGKDGSAPTFKQVGELWGQYQEWVDAGRINGNQQKVSISAK